MSNCPNCGNHGMRDGKFCDCVYGIEARLTMERDTARMLELHDLMDRMRGWGDKDESTRVSRM